ncbi:MAG: NAD-binding protein, partial [Spirochaetales bacterium]|nr:NAD-binding protein [Spirochaetales bacterium]
QHAKMANQIAVAANLIGAVESVTYARKAGLNPTTVLQSITTGAAGSWQLSNMVPRMLEGNFAPGFFIKHFLKDLRIALDAAREMKLDLPLLELAERLFEQLTAEGMANLGTHALYMLYEKGLVYPLMLRR